MTPKGSLCSLKLLKNFIIILFLASSVCSGNENNPSAELYSQNITSENKDTDTVLYSETRLRLFPFSQSWLLPYGGGYFNPYNKGPMFGVILPLKLDSSNQLQFLAEYRKVFQKNDQPTVDEGRYGVVYGSWYEFQNHSFLDSYAESVYIPRLSNTPVSTAFTRYGYRMSLARQVYFDPHIQLWGQLSNSADLAPGGLEFRPGLRLTWAIQDLALAAYVYHREKIISKTTSEWEAMFVVQGVLK